MKKIKSKIIIISIFIFLSLVISISMYLEDKYLKNNYNTSKSEKALIIKEKTYSRGKEYDELFSTLIRYYEAIEMSDYDLAFSMLDTDYINRNNLNKKTYEERMKNKYNFAPFPTITKHLKLGSDKYICYLNIITSELDEDDITVETKNLKETVILKRIEGKLYLSFDKYLGEEDFSIYVDTKPFNIRIEKIISYLNKKEIVLNVENKSDRAMNFWDYFKIVTLRDNEGNIYWVSNNVKTIENTIEQEDKKSIKLVFNSKIKKLKKLKFVKIEDSKVIEINIP